MRINFTAALLLLGVVFLNTVHPFAQDRGIYAERHILRNPAGDSVLIVVRLSESAFIASNEDGRLTRKAMVTIEFLDKKQEPLHTEIIEKDFSIPSPKERSAPETVDRVFKRAYQPGMQTVTITFTDVMSRSDVRRVQLHIPRPDSVAAFGIVVKQPDSGNTSSGYQLVNTDGVLHFSEKRQGLFVGVTDTSFVPAAVRLKGAENEISIAASFSGKGLVSVEPFADSIVVCLDTSRRTQSFAYFEGVNRLLYPGAYTVTLVSADNKELKQSEMLSVVWFSQPKTLQESSDAIQLLKIIDENADTLSRALKNKRMAALYDYWKKYDVKPAASFNKYMVEFYTRCDYALENFSSIKGGDGPFTDRGKTYIRFGNPKSRDRVVSAQGKIGELWQYENGKSFYFIDYSGAGKFELVESK